MPYRQDLFLEVAKQLRAGRTQDELSEALNQLVQDCRNTGKKGVVTLKITVKPDKGDNGQYFLSDEIVVKRPSFERGQTILFGTPDGNLQRTDPNQPELPLRSVEQPQQEPRFVAEPEQAPRKVD